MFETDGETKKDEADGMLMLSVADTLSTDASIASPAFMSYEYDADSGDFIINSRELIDFESPTPNGSFLNEFSDLDVDFYFAWVDFANPLSLDGLDGDFNGDGVVDQIDYAVWRENLGSEEGDLLSGNGDGGDVTTSDYNLWKANYGAGSTPSAASGQSIVPEPAGAALVLALLAAVQLSAARRKRTL